MPYVPPGGEGSIAFDDMVVAKARIGCGQR
jgi:hypothetical protein